MAENLAPGVYVEEVERGAAPVTGVSTSTAGFLGPTERGPMDPRLLTSFSDFTRLYGGYIEKSNLFAAVNGFFANGGTRCFLGRVTEAEETASATLTDDSGNGETLMSVDAIGPGEWGSRVALIVSNASMPDTDDELFKLTVRYWTDEGDYDDAKSENADTQKGDAPTPDVEEIYDDLSPNEGATNFVENEVNGASALIEVDVEIEERPDNAVADDDSVTDPEWLDDESEDDESEDDESGADEPPGEDAYRGDEKAKPEDRTGLAGFKQIPEISILCIPDAQGDKLASDLVGHCTKLGDRFAILQAEKSVSDVGNLRPPIETDGDMAAFYYPWLEVRNPETGLTETVPPGGHVAGIYARSDTEHGVHKAPANEVVRGITGIERPVTREDQESLNPRGVNCIRSFRGRGIRVWGARTASSNPQWKYVNVRRLFLFLKESIEEGTQWVVFEPNNEELWARVRQTIRNFLTDVWEDGALMGSNPDEAFFVKCDRTTMTQNDIENGRLICEIGVAPTRPAEFVIFRISQWTGDRT